MSLNLIRKNNQAAVTAYQDCVLFHFLKGHDYTTLTIGGVFNGVHNDFDYELDNVNFKFILKSGMGMIYGRQFELPGNETLEFDFSTLTGIKYILIYAEINTQDPTAQTVQIKAVSQALVYPTVASDDLISADVGIARMPLYTVYYDASLSSRLGSVVQKFMFYYSDLVERSKIALSLPGSSLINGRAVSALVNSNKDSVKLADDSEAIHAHPLTTGISGSGVLMKIPQIIVDGTFILGMSQKLVGTTTWTGNSNYGEIFLGSSLKALPNYFIISIYPSRESDKGWKTIIVPVDAAGFEYMAFPDSLYLVALLGDPSVGYKVRFKTTYTTGANPLSYIIRAVI